MSTRVLMAWSSGKDSAMALHALRQDGQAEVAALLTTVTEDYGRVSMHGVRRELLEAQAQSTGLPLEVVHIPAGCDDATYERRMAAALLRHREAGVGAVAFGDIFLADLRRYREERLAQVGMEAVFPIWRRDTGELARRFIADGFRAVVTCVDGQALDGRFAGRWYDASLLAELPAGVDPCGENGEFHTFACAGPVFRRPIACRLGRTVVRDGRFHFRDVLPLRRGPVTVSGAIPLRATKP